MLRIFMLGLGAVLIAALALGLYVFRLMTDLGAFRPIEAHFEGNCERMGGFAGGTEDVLIDRETGWVFVSSFDRRAALRNPDAAVRGAIEAFRLDAPEGGSLNLTQNLSLAGVDDFRPHGFSLYDGPEGKRLFVINHRADGRQAIELFDLTYTEDGTPSLRHVETITHPLIVSPNDLVAVGPRSFYVGNDFTTADREGLDYMLETYLRLDRTTLVYYDGTDASIAARGLTYANGVEVSNDGRTLYVSETTDGNLRVYDRDVESGALTQRAGAEGLLRLGSGLDNIDVDAAGRIWIGAHPKLFDVIAHAEDAANLSPAQILMIEPSDDGGGAITEVYLGDGSLASGSSVGAYDNGRLVIGVIFDAHVVVCDVTDARVVGE